VAKVRDKVAEWEESRVTMLLVTAHAPEQIRTLAEAVL
jgi:hypothetical protein